MKKLAAALFCTAQCFLSIGCHHAFSPKGPFEKQLVVYSVLSTDRDVQFVRVYTNYDVSGFDPFGNQSDTPVAGAKVVITGPHGSYILKDTLLQRPDTSRYKSPIAAYAGYWRAERGQTYQLTINAPGIGSTSATVSTPGTAQTIYWIKEGMLDHPDTYQGTDYVGASTRFWESTKAFSFQMVIDYVFISEGEWKEESIEVPIAANSSFSYVVYPSVNKVQVYAGGVYYKDPYMKALARVAKLHAGTKLIFNRIVFRFLQVDQNWYDYYNTVREFQDPFSIRLDDPDFTNLSNGYGLFGACAVDSIYHLYPDDFSFNQR